MAYYVYSNTIQLVRCFVALNFSYCDSFRLINSFFRNLDIASHAGQRLLCRTEYNAGVEGGATLIYAKHTTGSEEAKQNGILYGTKNKIK